MVRTRIPPSPTGNDLHIGNLYSALINWAYAHKHNGQFIVRIEDTDRTRFVEGAAEQILATLRAYDLEPDEDMIKGGPFGPYIQSQRLDLYKKYAQQLISQGDAYYCFCSEDRLNELREQARAQKRQPKYDRHCLKLSATEIQDKLNENTSYVIRLRIPDGSTTYKDTIRGEITIDNSTLDDQVLIKSDGYPTYHMAVVVDDHLMEISHVIRAEEWMASVPKHVILYDMLKWELPIFTHLPLLRTPEKGKISKRKGAVWASWYLEEGYLREAVLNYLALMAWSHPDQKEIFSLDEYIKVFDLKDINPSAPIFDVVKLTWMNGEYIRKIGPEELSKKLLEF
ncbi:MAG: glutamate--tRNA ligase, partial [Microgenomates group bacterium]